MSEQTNIDTNDCIFPPEIVEMIVNKDENFYAFSLVNRDCNRRYKFGVANDYLRGIKVVMRYCLDCDMIYQVGDKTYNMTYDKIPDDQRDEVVQLCQAINDKVAGDIRHSVFAHDPNCTHTKCVSTFGFDPIMLKIIRDRAQSGDHGLLKYIRGYIPTEAYKLLRETYNGFACGDEVADIEIKFYNLKGAHWQCN